MTRSPQEPGGGFAPPIFRGDAAGIGWPAASTAPAPRFRIRGDERAQQDLAEPPAAATSAAVTAADGASEPLARADGPTPEEIEVPVLETLDRAVTALITVVPPLLLVLAGWQLWNHDCTGATSRSSWSCTCRPGSA